MFGEWIPCEERLPRTPTDALEMKEYLTSANGILMLLHYADGWNCSIRIDGSINRDNEIKNIDAWMEVPKAYEV